MVQMVHLIYLTYLIYLTFLTKDHVAAFPTLQSSLKQLKFKILDNKLRGLQLILPQVKLYMNTANLLEKVASKIVRLALKIFPDGSLSVFSERFLTECSCLERKAIAVALRPI